MIILLAQLRLRDGVLLHQNRGGVDFILAGGQLDFEEILLAEERAVYQRGIRAFKHGRQQLRLGKFVFP